MTFETERALTELFTSSVAKEHFTQDESFPSYSQRVLSNLEKDFSSLFDSVAPKISDDFVEGIDEDTARVLKNSIKNVNSKKSGSNFEAYVGIFPSVRLSGEELDKIISASVEENTYLIRSIPKEYLGQIAKIVHRAITSGSGQNDIYKEAKQKLEISKDFKKHLKDTNEKVDRRAKLIARDQTHKVFNGISAKRMKNAGAERFQWVHHAGSLKPRQYHLDSVEQGGLNGRICSFDDLPIIDLKTGERGLPGQLVNCRCTMRMVVTEEELQTEES